ncbi:hypothetical protein [Neobacillus sp. SAB-20_R2A]|uniref:hypothetical protein n=1 Tax=Neobacillus sp. SAB-20_R2A TaxID=3120519 RepID=UPI003C6E9B98
MKMIFTSIIIIILLVYFLIVRPLTSRNRPQIMEPPHRNYYGRQDYYPSGGGGFGRFGTFAGGMAAGALLTYLFEQGRIGFDQFQTMQHLQDHEIMQQLMEQNIIQEDEIEQLREELGDDPNQDYDYDNADNDDQQDNYDQGDYDSGDDNWV